MSSGASDFVAMSPSNELIVINNSAYPVTYQDYSINDTVTGIWSGGLQLSGQTGNNFTTPIYSGTPPSGVYTLTLGITVIDAGGLSTSGVGVMTIIVP
jgi:hypothetical protein